MLLITKHGDMVWSLTEANGILGIPASEWPQVAVNDDVRILGIPENASIIASLAEQPVITWLGTPQLLSSLRVQNTPNEILLAMQSVQAAWLPPSLGGWHKACDEDFLVYAAAADTEKLEQLCNLHPVLRSLAAVPGIDLLAAAELMTIIRDPRWFIDREHPNRGSRLRSYVGLYRKRKNAIVTDEQDYRRELVRRIWRSESVKPAATNFLWRYWHDQKDRAYADLQTSRRLLSFMRYMWLAIAHKTTTESLFEPGWFMTSDELAVYKQQAPI